MGICGAAVSMIFKMHGDDEVTGLLNSLGPTVREAVVRKWQDMASRISERVKQRLSGEVLSPKTGALRSSIYGRVYVGTNHVTLSVGSRGDVPYAALHEYGGVIEIPRIEPSKARVLSFIVGGVRRYAMWTRAHPARYPARPYLRPTLDEMLPDIRQQLIDALNEASRRGRRRK